MNRNYVCFAGEGRKMQGLFKGSSLAFLLIIIFLLAPAFTEAQTFLNKNVTSRVNVTNAAPEILNITAMASPITLVAGSTRAVHCNVSIRDWNGFSDINSTTGVNATFYHYTNNTYGPDDMNVHYTNSSCFEVSTGGLYYSNYTCSTYLQYFANNGSWYCNVSVIDNKSYTDSEYKQFNISALYAVNVTDIIDYGNLSVTDYSDNITATITNFGNMNINVSVLGYGATQGDGLGFVCTQGSNITIENQRFSSSAAAAWGAKTALSTTNQDVGLTISQQTNDVVPVTALTYWQLYVPPNPFGLCTGTVRFTATTP
ncbi:MAG: hypothetical protein ACP5N3_04705 [Candidatus Nanoarchaeia archaeon]